MKRKTRGCYLQTDRSNTFDFPSFLFNHLNGWITPSITSILNMIDASQTLKKKLIPIAGHALLCVAVNSKAKEIDAEPEDDNKDK